MMMILLLILLLSFFHVTMIDYLYNNPTYYQLDAYTCESDDFRSMRLGNLIAESGPLDYDLLTSLMIEHNYDLTDVKDTACHTDRLLAVKPAEYRKLKQAYETVLGDLKFFPIPENTNAASPPVTFENGWMDKRTYGGERGHEGCDIMGTERPRGYYGKGGVAGERRMADRNPRSRRRLSLLRPFVRLQPAVAGGRCRKGRRAAGLYG